MTTKQACDKHSWTICEYRPGRWAATCNYEHRVIHGTQADSLVECERLTAVVGAEAYGRAKDRVRDDIAYARS